MAIFKRLAARLFRQFLNGQIGHDLELARRRTCINNLLNVCRERTAYRFIGARNAQSVTVTERRFTDSFVRHLSFYTLSLRREIGTARDRLKLKSRNR